MLIYRDSTGSVRGARGALRALLAVGALALSACDLGVVNPEIIEEDDLMIPDAIPAIVNGARHTFGMATTIQGAGGVYSASAALTDELTHVGSRSEEHTSELQSRGHLVCRLLLEKKKNSSNP